jgi:fumarate reductase iron-sulfur subunit
MGDQDKVNKVSVFRFDPGVDKAPRYDMFEVPFEEGRSVLGALKYIYENLDSSLAFYNSCRIGKCTGCHLKVNGKTRLACTTVVEEQDLLLEPMPGYRVVRDLMVDRTKAGTAEKAAK